MTKKKTAEKLPPVPKHRPGKPKSGPTDAPAVAEPAEPPDLSHIAPDLRSLAFPTAGLELHPKNPKKHSEKHIAGIAGSLKVNGQTKNIVASLRTGSPVVVCGNGTLRAALLLGWAHIAVSRQEMTEARENQLLLVDNALAAHPEYEKELVELAIRDVDTGNDDALDAILASLAEEVGIVPEDEKTGNDSASKALSVVVECKSIEDQDALFERLRAEGLSVRMSGRGRGKRQD